MPQAFRLDADLNLRTQKAVSQFRALERTIASRNIQTGFGGLNKGVKDFEQTLSNVTNRVVAFGAAFAVLRTAERSFEFLVRSTIDVEQALAKINVNLNQSAEGLKRFSSELFNIARQTGQTFDTAAKAAEELARQGLGAQETLIRLRDALILSRRSGLDAESSVEALTATFNTFRREALTTTEILNKFVAVDTKFAISAAGLAQAVSRVGSVAQEAGLDLDQLNAIITALQQTTARGAPVIANGLKTIFTRITSAPETIKALESVGVAIKDSEGNLRNGITVIQDYAKARQRLTEAEASALDRTISGTFQANVFKATVRLLGQEFGAYTQALNTSRNATDEAIRSNEQLNVTLAALINDTTLSVQQLFSTIGSAKIGPLFARVFGELKSARKFLSGETDLGPIGKDIGKSLGDGIIEGLANVLTGPALLVGVRILYNAFKQVGTLISRDLGGLLSLNTASQQRARIQERINFLLSNATGQEYAQARAAQTVLQQKQALLAIQTRLNQQSIAGTPLQNAILADPRTRRALGRVPNFADPIGAAIRREQAAGIPSSKIYLDTDPRVSSASNPAGLLVANKLDEPLGGFQGVNRVLAGGGNPKSIPNFADSSTPPTRVEQFNAAREIRSMFNELRKVKPLGDEFNKLGSRIQDASQKLGKAARENALGKLAREFNNAFVRVKLVQQTARTDSLTVQNSLNEGNVRGAQILAAQQGGVLQERGGRDFSGVLNVNRGRTSPNFTPADYRRLKERQALRRAEAQQRTNSRLLTASFVLPFAAGFVPSRPGGTAEGAAFGAISGAAQGTAFGAVLGPQGAAVGAAIGALVGAANKLSKSAEELIEVAAQAQANEEAQGSAAAQAAQVLEELAKARQEGASSTVIGRLQRQFSSARAQVSDAGLSAAIDSGDERRIQEAIASFGLGTAQRGAGRQAFGRIVSESPNRFGGDFSAESSRAIVSDLAALIGDKQLAGANQKDIGRVVSGDLKAFEAIDTVRESLAAISLLAPEFKDLEVTSGNVVPIARLLQKTFLQIRTNLQNVNKTLEETSKGALLLPDKSLLSPLNSSVGLQAALTGRAPRATRGERGQSQFAFFQELINSGAVSETGLSSKSGFKQAKALTQEDNLLNFIVDFLGGAGGSFQGYKTSRGFNRGAIETRLKSIAGSGTALSGNAELLLDLFRRSGETVKNAGVNTVGYVDNPSNPVTGFIPGADYGKFAKRHSDRSRRAPASGRNGAISSDFYDTYPVSSGELDDAVRRDADIEAALKTVNEAKKAALDTAQALAGKSININVVVNGLASATGNAALGAMIVNYLNNLGVTMTRPPPPGSLLGPPSLISAQ